jgi:membrane-associated protein
MSDFLLTQIINYGAPIVGITVLLGAIGIPMPGTLTIVAAGAFSSQGILSWPVAALIGLVGAVIGDSISYAMGYYARRPILKRFSGTSTWKQAEQSFQRWGGMSVFFSRFLVTAIAIPVNLLAGTGDFSYKRFMVFDIAGETVWILGFGGLGYLFSNEWELVGDFLSNFGGLTLGIVILGVGIWLAIRWMNNSNN